jgi:hypothetical protein
VPTRYSASTPRSPTRSPDDRGYQEQFTGVRSSIAMNSSPRCRVHRLTEDAAVKPGLPPVFGELVVQIGEGAAEQAGHVHLGDAEAVADLALGEVAVETHHEDSLLA